MFDFDQWQEIIHTITKNKMRSFLTAFGVFWGIFLLVLMIGFANGISNTMLNTLEGMQTNSGAIWPAPTSIPYEGYQVGRRWDITNQDVESIRKNFPEIKYISGMYETWGGNNKVIHNERNGNYNSIYVSDEYYKIMPVKIIQGRRLNHIDMIEHRKVCIIGKKVAKDLYKPGEAKINSLLQVNGIYYRVIGIATPYNKNVNIGSDVDEAIMIPLSTGQLVSNLGENAGALIIAAYPNVDCGDLLNRIKTQLKQSNHIDPNDEKATMSFNLSEMFNKIGGLLLGLRILIWIVGSGTLLAGAVGVCNIMLVTIKERTQEIGIRRALGATPRVIMKQILLESLLLTLSAGLFGIVLGVGILGMIGNLPMGEMTLTPQISFNVALSALSILVTFGLLAGALPSYRALSIKAIEALRDE